MAYSKIRQPKLSDVIEQQLEFLILEGTLRPGEKLPPERELAKQFDVSRSLACVRRFNASKRRGCCFVARGAARLSRAACGRASAIRWWSCCPTTLNHQFDLAGNPSRAWKASPLITPRCAAPMKIKRTHPRAAPGHRAGAAVGRSGRGIRCRTSSIRLPSPKRRHNVVLLHLLRCMEPMLAQNVRQNFELLVFASRDAAAGE